MDSNGNIHTENEKKSWKEDDDAYYFILHQEINGVPIEQSGYGDGYTGTGVEETKLEVIYGKKGWISFEEQWGFADIFCTGSSSVKIFTWAYYTGGL